MHPGNSKADVIHKIKRLKDKNQTVVPIHAEKTFVKIQHSFMRKENFANYENFPNTVLFKFSGNNKIQIVFERGR